MTPTEMKAVRSSLGLTQPEMARVVCVSPMSISRYECGVLAPSGNRPNGLPRAGVRLEASPAPDHPARENREMKKNEPTPRSQMRNQMSMRTGILITILLPVILALLVEYL